MTSSSDYRITFEPRTAGAPANLITDAEIVFLTGALAGLRLIGFGLWHSRKTAGQINVTFPARRYGNGRAFALLRPATEADTTDTIADILIDAWRVQNAATTAPTPAPARLSPPVTAPAYREIVTVDTTTANPEPEPTPAPATVIPFRRPAPMPEPERHDTPEAAAAAARAGRPIVLTDLIPRRPVTPQIPPPAGSAPLGLAPRVKPEPRTPNPEPTPGQKILF